MNRLDRALGILLLLRGGRTLSASELARRFEVSTRTIYRDVETLGAIGVPVYAEMGREGGFRLVEGFFLPPIMFTQGEATSLLTGLALLGRLRATPFRHELEGAIHKLLAALPEGLRARLEEIGRLVAFEQLPDDIFHPERDDGAAHSTPGSPEEARESAVVSTFLEAIFMARAVELRYRSPYRGDDERLLLLPDGLIWDRDRWYLVARPGAGGGARLWRADRVLEIVSRSTDDVVEVPALSALLGRAWLREAMGRWADESPVVIKLTAVQVALLRRDWYYGHARYVEQPDGSVLLTIGEDDRAVVFALLRWLGPGAELLVPAEWRAPFAEELREMLGAYRASEEAP